MLQNIKLDDKTYEEIRDEAISNIVKHCPEWTNHNASDPGITLIELFSSMTEMMLYRLNQVPQKNYVAFLDLIGIQQRLPIPAKGNVAFKLSEGYQMGFAKKDTILLKKDSVVTTEPKADEDLVVFETTRDLYLSNVKLLNGYSKKFNMKRGRDEIVNHSEDIVNFTPFKPFSVENKDANEVHIYLGSEFFTILKDDVKATLMFRLPTTMREYKIDKDFMKNMQWQFFDGFNWIELNVVPNYHLILDDRDADVFVVTFEGNNEEFERTIFEVYDEQKENFYIRGVFKEVASWLQYFMVYEMSLVASSNEEGVLPTSCFHNYEQLDMNNDFYPFGARPKIDNIMQDEVLLIRSDEAFSNAESMVSLEIVHSSNPEYEMARGSSKLQIVWQYPVGVSKWKELEVEDTTEHFTKNGTIVFKVPKDMAKITLNGEEGYWVRAKIASGDFGKDEQTQFDEKTGTVIVQESTLRPPLLERLLVHYTLTRQDLDECVVFNDFKYQKISFDKNRAVSLFKTESVHEEALILGFDSYVSDDYLDISFDIDNKLVAKRNIYKKQRVIKWELFQDGIWKELEVVVDTTDGLTLSGYVRIKLPTIQKLEKLTVYVEELSRLWLKARVKFNALEDSPVINSISLNSVDVLQKESFEDEFIARSVGLPNMKFKLNNTNLIAPPTIFVGESEFKAVERFIDYGKDDKVFRFNGITGEIEFGNGQYGAVPELGLTIVARKYAVTQGAKGNIAQDNVKVIRESINYIESVTNRMSISGGQDGDTLEDLKKYAPSVLKTMQRAVTIEDYQLLSESFSPFIKKTKCVFKDGEVYVIVLTNDIMQRDGFINVDLLRELEHYLKERSLITVNPLVVAPKVVPIKIFLKLKRTVENYGYSENTLSQEILQRAQEYFDPISGYTSEGYPIGKEITKGDLHEIINSKDSVFYMTDMKFQKVGSSKMIYRLDLAYNEIVKIVDIVIEDISYEV